MDRTMSAASRHSVMASVWLLFMVLAGLGAADVPSPETSGRLGVFEPLFSVFKSPRGRPDRRAYFPLQVWKFLKGKKPSALAALVLLVKCNELVLVWEK